MTHRLILILVWLYTVLRTLRDNSLSVLLRLIVEIVSELVSEKHLLELYGDK